MKKTPTRPTIAACVLAAGGYPAAGIVLYRVQFWKPTRQFGGKVWIAKSREELMFETGLTEQQVKDALAWLRKLGLIQTSQHQFRGKNVGHIRLTGKGQNALTVALDGTTQVEPSDTAKVEPSDTAKVGSEDTAQVGSTDTTSYTSYMQGESHMEDLQGEHPDGCGSEILPEDPEEIPAVANVKDVLAKATWKKAPKITKLTSGSLGKFWVAKASEVTKSYFPPLTEEDLGKLGHVIKRCPEGMAVAVVTAVLEDWIGFVKQVEYDAGMKFTPAKPVVSFLLKHIGSAVYYAAAELPAA